MNPFKKIMSWARGFSLFKKDIPYQNFVFDQSTFYKLKFGRLEDDPSPEDPTNNQKYKVIPINNETWTSITIEIGAYVIFQQSGNLIYLADNEGATIDEAIILNKQIVGFTPDIQTIYARSECAEDKIFYAKDFCLGGHFLPQNTGLTPQAFKFAPEVENKENQSQDAEVQNVSEKL